MKRLLLLSAISISMFAFITTGCQKDDEDLLPYPPYQERSLAGTKWKLAAFVDVKNNTSRPPDADPDFNNPWIFTLFFDTTIRNGMWCELTGHSIYGSSCGNQQEGLYIVDYDIGLLTACIGSTKAGECSEDGSLYSNILCFGFIFPFKLYADELLLYYNYKNYNPDMQFENYENYLLFKKVQ